MPVFRAEATQAIFARPFLRYDLILAQPTPPPSIGKADFMWGHLNRTDCSSILHKEGLRKPLAIGGL
ncbi:hypothetical protein BMW22_05155 [Rhizobium leguminosarum]|uniref:Uncharacterized protein n=1 Tax=Rhizobium leguminosarum TaxID=384 RepID=A0A1L3Z692_RHILE|nr:hypothetical protein BMW22_05155 [Rhizobium leguminosarum]